MSIATSKAANNTAHFERLVVYAYVRIMSSSKFVVGSEDIRVKTWAVNQGLLEFGSFSILDGRLRFAMCLSKAQTLICKYRAEYSVWFVVFFHDRKL